MLVPHPPTVTATLAAGATLTQSRLPAATTAFASHILELRSENYSYDLACISYIDALSCDSAYLSCLESVETDYYGTDYSYNTDASAYSKFAGGLSACYCNYGMQYLSCYYGAIGNQVCVSYFGTYDWTSYESYWYQDNCGTVPPDFGGAGKTTSARDKTPPSVVSLDLQSVKVVTATSQPPPLKLTYEPVYQSTGNLLKDECASTQFTLIEDVSTVYWAAYVGCASNQPQCCPWTAASEFFPATVTGNTTVTVTSTVTATGTAATGTNMGLNAFPVAADQNQAMLKSCASDYYSISGNCCPSNYWPFTRDLGGQTPCYSSLPMVTEAPTLTAGLVGEPTDTAKPTSAVVNVVWAMSYPVESKGGLSKGAIAGIAVGAIVAVAAIAALSFFLLRARRKNKVLQQQVPQQFAPPPAGQAPPPQEVQPVAGMAAVPLAYDANKQPGMVQVQPGGYGYPQQYPQQQLYPQQYPQGQPGYVDNRASLAPSSVTPVSQLAPQTTGTTNISELSTQGLVEAPSPAPAPIAEADESAAVAYQQQLQQQQQQQQYYQQQYQQPQGQPQVQQPPPGYVATQPVYGQPPVQQQQVQAQPQAQPTQTPHVQPQHNPEPERPEEDRYHGIGLGAGCG